MGDERILRLGAALVRRSDALWIFGAATALVVAGMAGMVSVVALNAEDPGAFATALLGELLADPVLAGLAVVVAVIGPMVVYGISRSRLRLTPEGLYGHVSPWLGLGLAGWSTGDIRIPWSQIRSADLIPGRTGGFGTQRLGRYRLILRTAERTVRLAPYLWLPSGGPDHRIRFRQAFRTQAFDADEVIEGTPLVREVRARDLFGNETAADTLDSPPAFDLRKHRGLSGQVVILLVALVFAVVDGLALNPYRLIGDFPWLFVVPLGLVAAGLVAITGRGAPRLERTVVGVLTVAAIVAASYPLFLRINGWTGSRGEVMYVATETGEFKPVNGDFPRIRMPVSRTPEYWAEFPENSTYTFMLVRGVGGVYQLDMRPVYADMRLYHEYRRKQESGSG